MKENQKPVAIINSTEDIIEAISLILMDAGFLTVTAISVDFKKGRKDVSTFLKKHDPKVIVYDIAPPYEENWQFFKNVKNSDEAKNRTFILTTTNKDMLEKLTGKTDAIEIVGKPFDMKQIVDAVKKAI
ncbi:MAG TPA: hypothetical protein VK338_02885 [Candidatus Nitrosocosmicus sp.]|nr:hypothetical protein [Candidatus Nitrosocosmicus sp.]